MNLLRGNITETKSSGELILVEVKVSEDILSSIVIEESLEDLKPGREINLLFKETEVALGVNVSGKISMRNQLVCQVIQVERGTVLTVVKLDYKGNPLTAIITTKSAELLAVAPGLIVTAFIKTNELMIMKA